MPAQSCSLVCQICQIKAGSPRVGKVPDSGSLAVVASYNKYVLSGNILGTMTRNSERPSSIEYCNIVDPIAGGCSECEVSEQVQSGVDPQHKVNEFLHIHQHWHC